MVVGEEFDAAAAVAAQRANRAGDARVAEGVRRLGLGREEHDVARARALEEIEVRHQRVRVGHEVMGRVRAKRRGGRAGRGDARRAQRRAATHVVAEVRVLHVVDHGLRASSKPMAADRRGGAHGTRREPSHRRRVPTPDPRGGYGRIARIEGNGRVIPRGPATPRARTLVRGDASRARGRRGGEVDRPGDGADQQRRLCESRFPRARSVITPPRAMDPPPPDAGEDLPAGAVDPSAYHAAYAAVGPPPGVAPPPGIAPPEGDPRRRRRRRTPRRGQPTSSTTPPPRSTRTGVPTARRTRTRRRDTPRPRRRSPRRPARRSSPASPRRSPRSSPPPRRPRPRLRLPRASPSAAPAPPPAPPPPPSENGDAPPPPPPPPPAMVPRQIPPPPPPPEPAEPAPATTEENNKPRRSSSGARAAPPRAHPPPPPPRPPHHPPSDPRRDRNGATPPPPPSRRPRRGRRRRSR